MKLSLDDIRQRFRASGLKVTPQRAAIYGALAETTGHPTAEALYRQVKRRYPMISPNTVYYTLGALREAGLIQEVNYGHDGARFDANMAPHHHLVCLGCRAIRDVMDARLDRLKAPRSGREPFDIVGHRVEFHGYCGACRPARGRGQARRRSDRPRSA
jgi:Fur family peroxide stress response transcriptional regulator